MSDSENKSNPVSWIIRGVLLVVLVIAVLLFFAERSAQDQFQKSFQALGAQIDAHKLYQRDIDGLLVGKPKREKVNEKIERFVWSSPASALFGVHALRLHYEAEGYVSRIEDERATGAN